MHAIYILQIARKGVSSLQLSKEVGITQKSAWHMLHRIREACVAQGVKLQGIVEPNEAYFYRIDPDKHLDEKDSVSLGG